MSSSYAASGGQVSQIVIGILEELAHELYPKRHRFAIEPETLLEQQLGIDSLARMELLNRLEKALHSRLDEEALLSTETVGDLIRLCSTQGRPETTASKTGLPEPEQVSRHQGFPEQAQTLVEALAWHKEKQPDNACVYLYTGDIDQPEIITYRALWNGAYRVCAGIRGHGVGPGEAVALMFPTGKEFLYSFFGVLMAGAVATPIYPPFRLAQIEEHLKRQTGILENSQAVLLISAPEAKQVGVYLKARLPKLLDVVTFDELSITREAGIIQRETQDTAFMQYTSGSTGNPKGVVLSHANLLANIRYMGKTLKVTADDVFVSWLPLYHDMGLIGAWLGSLYHGFPLVLMPPLSFIARPYRWLQALSRHRGTLSAGPNFAFEISTRKIRDDEIAGIDLSAVRVLCNGAEPIHYQTLEKFSTRFAAYGLDPGAICPVYGLAESSVGLAFPPLRRGPKVDTIDADKFYRKRIAVPADSDTANVLHIVACGYPLADHEVRIVDDKGRELAERQVGRLQFRGPSATRGYFRNPEANAGLFEQGWLNSGDFAYIAEGEIYITGRAKDMIIRAGRNIYPYELEQAIGEIDGVHKGNVAVFSSLDKEQGTEKLVVLAESRVRDPDRREQIKQRIQQITTDIAQLPADDIVLAPLRTILKTSSGKIRRLDCKRLYEQGLIGKSKSIPRQYASLLLHATGPYLRRQLNNLKEVFYTAYAWLLCALATLLLWPASMLIPGRKIPLLLMKAGMKTVLFLLGIRYEIRGTEHIPRNRPCILVCNHMSYLDTFVLGLALTPDFSFVAKQELQDIWFVRVLLRKMNTFFVERFDTHKSVEDSNQIIEATRHGTSLVFFPEGTFTRAPGLRNFKLGAFVAAADAGVPILPAAIRGTRSILRGSDWRPRRGRFTITFNPPIQPRKKGFDEAVRLRNLARDIILKDCGEPDLEA